MIEPQAINLGIIPKSFKRCVEKFVEQLQWEFGPRADQHITMTLPPKMYIFAWQELVESRRFERNTDGRPPDVITLYFYDFKVVLKPEEPQ